MHRAGFTIKLQGTAFHIIQYNRFLIVWSILDNIIIKSYKNEFFKKAYWFKTTTARFPSGSTKAVPIIAVSLEMSIFTLTEFSGMYLEKCPMA